ncbi:hypothetical protein GTX53_24265 [Streptomyces sp. SID5594]|uniref:hypothetical protein n=1 Tax=unclassified Streptomyces TaxID=2593676 RepID=UPI000369009C|nr:MULTISPECIES: hypothetical protein [unclassified Streptomyces]MZF56907.1 hypothetical protein [Streptomyces sp. SID5594]
MTYPRTPRSRIPAAAAAIIAAVIEDNPNAGADTVARLAVLELSREGWHWHLGHSVLCAAPRPEPPPGCLAALPSVPSSTS